MYTETYISEVKKRAKEIITKEIQEVTNKYKVRVVFIDKKEIIRMKKFIENSIKNSKIKRIKLWK